MNKSEDPKRANDEYEVKAEYDFGRMVKAGGRSESIPEAASAPGKVRITIRIDQDLYDWFGEQADKLEGRTGYQTLINSALRDYMQGKVPSFEESLRRIIREELKGAA